MPEIAMSWCQANLLAWQIVSSQGAHMRIKPQGGQLRASQRVLSRSCAKLLNSRFKVMPPTSLSCTAAAAAQSEKSAKRTASVRRLETIADRIIRAAAERDAGLKRADHAAASITAKNVRWGRLHTCSFELALCPLWNSISRQQCHLTFSVGSVQGPAAAFAALLVLRTCSDGAALC